MQILGLLVGFVGDNDSHKEACHSFETFTSCTPHHLGLIK